MPLILSIGICHNNVLDTDSVPSHLCTENKREYQGKINPLLTIGGLSTEVFPDAFTQLLGRLRNKFTISDKVLFVNTLNYFFPIAQFA